MKMHLAGKTEQAKADLARLAIIRKQREEAARKKEEERKGSGAALGGVDRQTCCVTWLPHSHHQGLWCLVPPGEPGLSSPPQGQVTLMQ